MRSAPDSLVELIRPAVEGLGYELVGVELMQRGAQGVLLRVYIDSEQGIDVDDCGAVSHQVSGVLDVEDPIRAHYTLEVSSPGFDRPLFSLEHFERFTGCKARLKLGVKFAGRRNLIGIIRAVDGDGVVIEEQGETYRVPLDQIDTARLVPDY
jgi:ribosome maturation factor RimP